MGLAYVRIPTNTSRSHWSMEASTSNPTSARGGSRSFVKVEVDGFQSVTIRPTPEADAHGWSDAFGPVPLLPNGFSTNGRRERSRPLRTGDHTRPASTAPWWVMSTPPVTRLRGSVSPVNRRALGLGLAPMSEPPAPGTKTEAHRPERLEASVANSRGAHIGAGISGDVLDEPWACDQAASQPGARELGLRQRPCVAQRRHVLSKGR